MINIGEDDLTLEQIESVARYGMKVGLSRIARERIAGSHQRLMKIIQSGKPVYGINTGFGVFADQRIPESDSSKLSRNIILSHAVATGSRLPADVTRAAMLVRANTFAQGYSGVSVEIVETILSMLNEGVTPLVPSQGSLGSSGDLSLLAHMALVLTTDEKDLEEESGQAEFHGKILSGKEAMNQAGIQRIILGPKEGLAITNGATFSAAMAALNLVDARYLVELGELATSMSLEAMLGCSDAFDERLHTARRQTGQIKSANKISTYFAGSSLVDSTCRVQDAYSLRCSPQVHGAVRDTVQFAWEVIEREVNAATDNPLLFEPAVALSGGNFHGEPVGMVMDFLGIAVAEIGAISERRVYRLTDGKTNFGLPPMLVDTENSAGLNSGLMMPQYTAVSLVLENQTIASPDSVHSLPTSAGQEDLNANAMTASRHTYQIIENTMHVLAIELFTVCRAIDLRLKLQQGNLGVIDQQVYVRIRERVPYIADDTLWGKQIEMVKAMIMNHELLGRQ